MLDLAARPGVQSNPDLGPVSYIPRQMFLN